MNILTTTHQKLTTTWWMLRITYGLLFIIAGADKFFNIITHWPQYVSPFVLSIIRIHVAQFILIVGVIEIVIGFLVFTKWLKIGAYCVATWLLLISLNLLTMGTYFDIAVRDTVMAVGAIALAFLTDIKDEIV